MSPRPTSDFSGGLYDASIISFYEDIILELQKQVVQYRELWEAASKAAHEKTSKKFTSPVKPCSHRRK